MCSAKEAECGSLLHEGGYAGRSTPGALTASQVSCTASATLAVVMNVPPAPSALHIHVSVQAPHVQVSWLAAAARPLMSTPHPHTVSSYILEEIRVASGAMFPVVHPGK